MIGKKINQLATELAPTTTDLTIIGDPVTGVSKKITLEQLGAIFGGAVSFYTTLGDFPVTGVIDIIYCAKDTKKLYLWSGSAYVEVFPSQSLLDTYQLRSEKGVSNGYASLDVNGKVPIGQLPNSIMEYKGTWNAATNTPTLANGTGDTGDVYICSVAGTVNFGAGPITFAVGDYVVYSGTIWQRSSGAVGTVTSVGLSITGDAIGVSNSPITTSGTLALAFAGTGAQYIKGDGTLATFPNTIAQAQNLITEVYNNTGATLTKGTIVYINGGQGNLPTVTKALATSDATSAQTYGVVQTDITNMNNGYVVVEGRLSDLDTQAYANGTQLYLSPTTAGTWTSTKPYAPNHLVYVGIVVRSHPTQGVVEVKIMNGFEMDELHNVAAQSPDNNDILQYKTATSLWTKVAGTTSNIAEGSNLYYTDARSRAALSFTAGSGAYNSTTGVITIPTNTNQLTNGAAFITLASLSAGAGISYNNTTGVIASTITQYTDAMARASISLTTTGTSGAATYNNVTGVLNIPQYQTALTNPVTGTGTTNYLPKFTGASTIGNSIVSESGSALSVAGSVDATIANLSLGLKVTGSNLSSGTGAEIVYSSGKGIFLTFNRGAGTYLPTEIDGSTVTLSTSGTPRLNLNASGNLGLGVTPSAWGSPFIAFQLGTFNQYIAGQTNAADMKLGTNHYYGSGDYRYGNSTDRAARYDIGKDGFLWQIAPSGTAGNAISFTQAMTLDASANLIVGTTTAIGKVTFQQSTDSTVGGLAIVSVDGNGAVISRLNDGGLTFRNGGAERMRIASTGAATFSSSVTASSLTVGSLGSGSDAIISLATNASGNPRTIYYKASTAAINFTGTGGSDLMTLTNGGNLGIGTTSPAALLHVNTSGSAVGGIRLTSATNTNGSAFVANNAGGDSYFGRNNSTGGAFGGDAYSTVVYSGGAYPMSFYTNDTERMRITSGGNVEMTGTIKTASPSSGSAHAWKLGSYAAGGTGTATGVIYIEVNGQIYSIPALLGTP